MLKKLIISASLIICLFSTTTAKVYDIAGIIEKNQAEIIDFKIANYEEKTGIIITVITAGFGDERFLVNEVSDNEIIITIIPHKKISKAEVGKGLRHWITGTYASLILRRNMSGIIRKDDYAIGIKTTISDIIDKLGSQSITERMTQIRISNSKEDKFVNAILSVFIWALIFVSFCLTGFFILSRKMNMDKIRKRKLAKFSAQKKTSSSSSSTNTHTVKVREDVVADELVK